MSDFSDAARRLAANSPYVIEETGRGFDVRLDLADARWYELFSKAGLKETFVHHVNINAGPRSYTVLDDMSQTEWVAGLDGRRVPRLSGKMTRVLGMVFTWQFKKIYAFDEQGRYGAVVDYSFNSIDGHKLIRAAAKETGYRFRLNGTSKFALVCAAVGASSIILVPLGLILKGLFQ